MHFNFSWENFYDPESELLNYKICLGESRGKCDEIDNVLVGLNTTYTFQNLALRHGKEYYVSVTANNRVGLSTKVTSNVIKVDLTPPAPVEHMTGNLDGVCNQEFADSCNQKTPSGDSPHSIFICSFLYFFYNINIISYIRILKYHVIKIM